MVLQQRHGLAQSARPDAEGTLDEPHLAHAPPGEAPPFPATENPSGNAPRSPRACPHQARQQGAGPGHGLLWGIEFTFGFCSRELAGRITGRIAPTLDQHGACELNARGKPICPRLGVAADFLVPDESMLEVAQWIVANTPFDRLYYYGDRQPVHISVGPEANG